MSSCNFAVDCRLLVVCKEEVAEGLRSSRPKRTWRLAHTKRTRLPTRPQAEGSATSPTCSDSHISLFKSSRPLKLITANSTRRHQKTRTKSEPCSINSHSNWKRSAKDSDSNLCRTKQKQTQLETHVTLLNHFSITQLSCFSFPPSFPARLIFRRCWSG